MTYHLIILLMLAFSLSLLMNYLLIKHSEALTLIDEPNHRSSHTIPTPRGGGLGIIIGFLATGIILFLQTDILSPYLILFTLAAIIAAIGLYDDFGHCPALIRLIIHFLTIAVFLVTTYHLMPLTISSTYYYLGFMIALWAGAWLINLYNFMDGIDGLAGMEAIFVSLAAALSLSLSHQSSIINPLFYILAASAFGFLIWNKPPAKIFMGDAGSGFLGFIFAGFIIYTVYFHQIDLCNWLIWLSIFFVDATYTLLVRLCTRQNIFAAHRSHAFQILSRRYQSHRAVTLLALAYNILWLLPLSLVNLYYPQLNIMMLLLATLPLIFLCWKVRAGLKND